MVKLRWWGQSHHSKKEVGPVQQNDPDGKRMFIIRLGVSHALKAGAWTVWAQEEAETQFQIRASANKKMRTKKYECTAKLWPRGISLHSDSACCPKKFHKGCIFFLLSCWKRIIKQKYRQWRKGVLYSPYTPIKWTFNVKCWWTAF